jgi:hypothetical protein
MIQVPQEEEELAVSGSPEAPAATSAADLEAFVRAWAQAWSDQRVEDYLSFYSAAFAPPSGESREEWANTRQDRLSRPEFIEVEVSNFRVEASGPERATVTFDQRYRSNTFEDRVVKTFELVRESGLWKIGQEEAK